MVELERLVVFVVQLDIVMVVLQMKVRKKLAKEQKECN